MQIKDRVFIVTGVSSGIGLPTVIALCCGRAAPTHPFDLPFCRFSS